MKHNFDAAKWDEKVKQTGKLDMNKTMNVTELKAAVKWLYEYLGIK